MGREESSWRESGMSNEGAGREPKWCSGLSRGGLSSEGVCAGHQLSLYLLLIKVTK